MFGYRTSSWGGAGAQPHLTLGSSIALYVKGDKKRKIRPNTARGREKRIRRIRLRLNLE